MKNKKLYLMFTLSCISSFAISAARAEEKFERKVISEKREEAVEESTIIGSLFDEDLDEALERQESYCPPFEDSRNVNREDRKVRYKAILAERAKAVNNAAEQEEDVAEQVVTQSKKSWLGWIFGS